MSETKHTLGPWVARKMQIHSARGTWVATVKQGRADAIEAADARLIAAAPDLLEALEALVGSLEPMIVTLANGTFNAVETEETIAARAAISKARGQP